MPDWDKIISEHTNKELDEILLDFKRVNSDILLATCKELEKRAYKTDKIELIESEIKTRNQIFKTVASKNFPLKVSFKWTPKQTASPKTKLPKELVIKNFQRAMFALDWDVVHFDKDNVEGKSGNDWGKWSEKITVEVADNIRITSKSLQNNLVDFGKNNRRIEELKLAFSLIEAEYDSETIESDLEELRIIEEKTKYQVPDELTKPKILREKKMGLLVGGGILTSVIIGAVLAVLSSVIYIILLFDSGIGFLTALAFGYLIKISGISDFKTIKLIGFGSVTLTYLFSQIFRLIYIVKTNNIEDATLIDFLMAKLNHGLLFKDLNLGAIGLIIAWIFEYAVAIFVFYIQVIQRIITYDLDNAPRDVLEFAAYQFDQGKNEDAVRIELAQKGWREKEQQDLIFKALGAEVGRQQIVRAE
ncbi:hypothetical protein [Maribellus maritimus]|uniref:hypothetical protein n=1 Tax=Maribellus maritimus TaxID=2870838 RepID=UPI001EEA3309|nr:hypothetical protein [Maribellus maritimus]MCG6191557.1 hypothetical protein [Maribellus maritimus]